MKTGLTIKGLLASVMLMLVAAPVMADKSSGYNRYQRSGAGHVRAADRVEYASRRHVKRERHNRRDYNSGRHDRKYNGHRARIRYDRHPVRYWNRHNRHDYGYRKHSYWRYPLTSYYSGYDSSPYYAFSFSYFDW